MSKILIILIAIVLLIPGIAAQSLDVAGKIQTPTYSAGVITDHNNFKYSSQADGLYRVQYGSQSTYFGFGLSGVAGTTPFSKLSTDYSWSTGLTGLSNGYKAVSSTTNGEWQTEFTFTDRKTKILNKITNPLAVPITDAKFYYIFSVSTGDQVKYKGQTFTIPSSPNVHLSGDLNNHIPQVVINDVVLFDFFDITQNGFNVTDVYVLPASAMGFNSAYNVIAIAFTKGNGQINPGETVSIDPSLEQSGGSVTLYGNQNYDYVNLSNGAVLYVAAYNGTSGTGTLNLTVANSINVDSTSSINGAARGYRGGSVGGNGGEGTGGGTAGQQSGCGGVGTGGGAGSYGTAGGNGGYVKSCGLTPGSGGATYGTTSGLDITMGSGSGGAGTTGNSDSQAGGAALSIYANAINIQGALTFNGGSGGTAGSAGGGGGAAGGGILLYSYGSVNFTNAVISAAGGAGGSGGSGQAVQAQSGGGGRVKVFYHTTYTNTTSTISSGTSYVTSYNTAPTISNISSSYNLLEGQTLYIDANYADANGDIGTFTDNSTKWNVNSVTGVVSWTTLDGDQGTYNWRITVSDGLGGSAYTDFTVTAGNSTPSVISNLANNTGNFWINWTYTGGSNDDDYDIWINNSDLGADTTNLYYNATYAAHATRTISVRGHNHTLGSYSSWTNQTTTIANNAPVMVNISLTPLTPLDTDTLTVSSNGTDGDSDTITKHYLWYKNSSLQTTWTDSTYILPTGNFSANDLIYVSGYVNDGYINSSFLSSGIVQINGSNPAPILSGISLSSSTRKYNKTIYVNTTANVTDASSLIIFRTYYKMAEVKYYLNNSSWVAPNTNFSLEITIPFNDGLTHNIYVSVEDSGNMTSSEAFVVFTSDINAPSKLSESLSAGSTTIGSTITIYLSTVCQQTSGFSDCTVNNATVSLLNGGTGNVTTHNMSFYSGVLWYYTFSPSTTGVYSVSQYSVTDDSNVTGTLPSSLSFTVNPVSSGSSGSPGGGLVVSTTSKPLVPEVVNSLYEGTTGIHIQDLREDHIGNIILWIVLIISLAMIWVALTKKGTKESVAAWGMILFAGSTFALGWWA